MTPLRPPTPSLSGPPAENLHMNTAPNLLNEFIWLRVKCIQKEV